ncbi:unnamed protein product [Sympodiomycopsis kandeliae]
MDRVKTSKSKTNNSKTSSEDGDSLAALQAHFLESFGSDYLPSAQAASSSSRDKKGKRKASQQGDQTEQVYKGDEIDDIMSSRQAGTSSTVPKKTASQAKSSTKRAAPETIVFDQESSRGSHGDDDLDAKKNWRAFMNTKTANTEPEAMTSASDWIRERTEKKKKEKEAKAAARREKGGEDEEDEEVEAEQKTNDRELSHLLNTTLFARGSNSKKSDSDKPDLSSHDTLSRILELSSSNKDRKGQTFGRGFGDKSLRAQQLSKMPSKMRQGIREAAGERAAKEVEKNRELGLLNSKYSRNIMGQQVADATMTGKKATSRDRERGLGMGIGKFKNGTLHLSKDEVRRSLGESGRRDNGGKNSNNKKQRRN